MARLGADYDALAMWNPKLIYCSFSGYGQNGPYKDLPGHDINFEALAGLLSVTRSLDERRPAIPGVPVADLAGGFNAALAILASLRTRDRTGRGEFIDVSIYDTAVTLLVLGLARYFATGEEPLPGETLLTGSFPFYSLYETKDGGWLSVATVEPKFWQRMCELIGAPELSDRQFAEVAERPAIAETLAARFLERTLAEWEELFFAEKLPIAGGKRVPPGVRGPQGKARRPPPPGDVPGVGKLQVISHPPKHTATETRNPARGPKKGPDTETNRRSLGDTSRQTEPLGDNNIIAT